MREDRPSRRELFERPFTIVQAARILGTSPDTVRRLLREGQIEHERISPRRTVIRESAIRAYIDSVTVEARP
jgi:excisionase family DNA binding protein